MNTTVPTTVPATIASVLVFVLEISDAVRPPVVAGVAVKEVVGVAPVESADEEVLVLEVEVVVVVVELVGG
jgi:hypothetical protein